MVKGIAGVTRWCGDACRSGVGGTVWRGLSALVEKERWERVKWGKYRWGGRKWIESWENMGFMRIGRHGREGKKEDPGPLALASGQWLISNSELRFFLKFLPFWPSSQESFAHIERSCPITTSDLHNTFQIQRFTKEHMSSSKILKQIWELQEINN